MAELNGDLGVGFRMDEIDEPFPRLFVLAAVEPGAAGRDAALSPRRRSSR